MARGCDSGLLAIVRRLAYHRLHVQTVIAGAVVVDVVNQLRTAVTNDEDILIF